jgi:hypothetical protein
MHNNPDLLLAVAAAAAAAAVEYAVTIKRKIDNTGSKVKQPQEEVGRALWAAGPGGKLKQEMDGIVLCSRV